MAELGRLVGEILKLRELCPDGSNVECMAMDQLNEFLGKLDLEDFRKIDIQALVTG